MFQWIWYTAYTACSEKICDIPQHIYLYIIIIIFKYLCVLLAILGCLTYQKHVWQCAPVPPTRINQSVHTDCVPLFICIRKIIRICPISLNIWIPFYKGHLALRSHNYYGDIISLLLEVVPTCTYLSLWFVQWDPDSFISWWLYWEAVKCAYYAL